LPTGATRDSLVLKVEIASWPAAVVSQRTSSLKYCEESGVLSLTKMISSITRFKTTGIITNLN